MITIREIKELTMVDARRELTKLPEKLQAEPATVSVTRRGKPVLAIMTWEDYQAIQETIDILNDSNAVERLYRGIKEVQEGKRIPWGKTEEQFC